MKRGIIVILFLTAMLLSACDIRGNYDDGYKAGYEAGHQAGYSSGYDEGYQRGWDVGYDGGYLEGYEALRPVKMPESGTILTGKEYNYCSKITVTASHGASYVVSLRTYSGEERLSFFVKSGETVTVGVPAEWLQVYFASGSDWYGYGKGLMFGDETCYSKDDELLDFYSYEWEYTLYPVYDGNFSETPIQENDFF